MKAEIESYLKDSFINFSPRRIERAVSYNSPIIFDAGSFGETLASIIYNCIGCGTQGGGSFDLADGKEIKSINKFQSKNCKDCKGKNSFFSKKCVHCGGEQFKYANDSRAGISTSSHFLYEEELGDYIIFQIVPDTYEYSCRSAKIYGYRIEKNNQWFRKMLLLQKEKGSNTKNLLTTSVEFYMSAPAKIFEASVDFSQEEILADVSFLNPEYNEGNVLPVPKELFTKTRQYKQYFPLLEDIEYYDACTNVFGFQPLVGSHGKERGEVLRKNLATA